MNSNKKRVLIIDDSEAIHQDFLRILSPEKRASHSELDRMADLLFGPAPSSEDAGLEFELDSAFQGQEGLAKVEAALAEGRPYELIFLDYRMPPGWSGIETLRRLRKVAPTLPVVLCSAYSDYSWEEIVREFGGGVPPVELRKPFNSHDLREVVAHVTQSAPAP